MYFGINIKFWFKILIVLLHLLIPFWIYVDASKRGKNFINSLIWAIGGLFFGVFAIFAWCMVRPLSREESGNLCPECKQVCSGRELICPNCGHVLKGEVVELSRMEDENPQDETALK